MHGLPCSSLQYCFGSPADVSAEPGQHTDQNTCHTDFGPTGQPQPISVQPAASDPVPRPGDSPECIHVSSTINATNGTEFNSSPEPVLEDVHHLQSSPSLRELSDDEAQEDSPDLGLPYRQIPRPSIILHPQVRIEP